MSRNRVIDQLRKLYPGRWAYEGMGRWQGPDFAVQAYSNVTSSSWLGNGDIEYTTYQRQDTFEQLPIVGPHDVRRAL